ncbi:MAG TPA: nucleotidyltransferase domain-containing protein [Egibacteraceae bacterium]|nr:nucleotidyltransferase domain-containing protein [Actinomycetota bacterium]HWB71136.1 nucleotidyltransferase domain-containing protein [Egibacteraceae bacterium]
MDPVVQQLRDAAAAALSDAPVRFLYLFGSAATGRARPDSDVDIAVYLDPSLPRERYLDVSLDLAHRLETATRLGPVDVLALNDAPLPLAGRVLRERVVVYSRDEPLRVRFESLKLREFLDFQIHAQPLDLALLRAMAEGRR